MAGKYFNETEMTEKEKGYQEAVFDFDRELADIRKKHLAEWKDGEMTEAKDLIEKIFEDVFKIVEDFA